jgi:Tat protein translocase TatB subunit
VNIFGVGTSELLLILVIAMLVVGPERMVKLARDAGKALARLRQITESVTKEFRETFSLELDEEGESSGQGSPTVAGGADAAHATVDAHAKVVAEVVPALEAGPPEGPADLPVSGAAQLQAELASELVDGEIEVRPLTEMATAGAEAGADGGSLSSLSMEAVAVEVATLVPADADVEPVEVNEVVLVAEADMADQATEGET